MTRRTTDIGSARPRPAAAAPRRRGSSYVLVLGVSMIVTVIGLSAVSLSRIELRRSTRIGDHAEAQVIAVSAIEHALLAVEEARDAEAAGGVPWREAFTSGAPSVKVPLGRGEFTWTLVDEVDGDLADDPLDPVVIIATSTLGSGGHRLSVRMEPGKGKSGLSCLEVAAHAGNDIFINTPAIVSGSVTISANNLIEASGAVTVNPDSEAVRGFLGVVQPGKTTADVPPRRMPDGSVFEYYLEHGTRIDYDDLTLGFGERTLSRVVLSPFENPYGAADPEGIYIIDCRRYRLRIEDCRIVGTLVVLSPGDGSIVDGSVNWEPAIAHYPSLLVDGDLTFRFGGDRLDESPITGIGVNLNPVNTPFQGESDNDRTDSYASVLAGLVYVSGALTIDRNSPTVEGVLVTGGDLFIDGVSLSLHYRDVFLSTPPPGFEATDGPLCVVDGSWTQVVNE